jgi:hypothetical protein
MNPILPLITAGTMYMAPIVPQTFYIANLSETDGAKCGEYISITPMPVAQDILQPTPITPFVMPEEREDNSEE